jgi:alanine-synthesizing transaminase
MYGFPHVSLEEALHSLCTIKLRGPQWNPRERHRRNSPTNPDTNPMAKPMRFSQRTNWNTAESELARAHRERVAAGLPIADLTASNPTKCGFAYPASLLDALTDRRALEYDPQPKGLLSARKAVCDYYAALGVALDPNQIVLTTSTSEAYSFLFRLLCDPGDEILIPQPSYPLFDFLAGLDDVRLKTAPLVYENGWQIDAEGIRRAITPLTRAIVIVHPNNPTGHYTKPWEAEELAQLCREFRLSLIVDEVFLDYSFGADVESFGDKPKSFALGIEGVPVFVVSGLSKIAALPQMKAAWIVATGREHEETREHALNRLEVIADTFLSMNAPVQLALPTWLGARAAIQEQIRQRVAANLAELDDALEATNSINQLNAVQRLKVEGGWYAVLRIPAIEPDERTVLGLLERGVWVHPGYFFGMAESGWLVVSLLAPEAEFSNGVAIMIDYLGTNHGRNVTDRLL